MLSKAGGGCSTFEERLDVLLQAHYFMGRMASMAAESVAWGRRRRLYEEAVPEGVERNSTSFEEWWNASGETGERPCSVGPGLESGPNVAAAGLLGFSERRNNSSSASETVVEQQCREADTSRLMNTSTPMQPTDKLCWSP